MGSHMGYTISMIRRKPLMPMRGWYDPSEKKTEASLTQTKGLCPSMYKVGPGTQNNY
jgi:hypothetical protein